MSNYAPNAIRAVVRGEVQQVGFRDAAVREARRLGVAGWVRNGEDGAVLVHAEGPGTAIEGLVAFLHSGPSAARVEAVDVEPVEAEGHEQFAIRGVAAGRFVVEERPSGPRYALSLEVGGEPRSWLLPKAPSMEPADKRFAIEVGDGGPNAPEAEAPAVWDEGAYEQGGRVAWPEALERGHAVFVLHGEKLSGGFALQRTAPGKWLLIKRRDPQ